MSRRTVIKTLLATLGVLLLVGLVLWWWNADPERRWRFLGNPGASCANCRSFIYYVFSDYAEKHEGWYPRGGRNPLDSLAKAIPEGEGDYVHCFTSHAQAQRHWEYWEKHKTFTPEYCCYRYNEGLREDDPSDLILMYYFKPTRWADHSWKMEEVGRPVSGAGHRWEWVSEKEFQERQQKTVKYIQERNSKAKGAGAQEKAPERPRREALEKIRGEEPPK